MSTASPTRSTLFTRLSSPLGHRLWFLLISDLLLLGFIFVCTQQSEKGSFLDELARFGPNVAPRMLAGLALTGIILAGAIDLSIGSIIVVAGTVFGIFYHHGFLPSVCFAACFATAWGLSVFNGYLIRFSKLPPIIVTLAGLTLYRGMALVLADVCIEDFSGQISVVNDLFRAPGRDYAGYILLVALTAAVCFEAFGKTPRLWLGLGNSGEACRLSGLRPSRVRQSAFLVGGLFLGLAALTEVTNQLTIEPARLARGFELEVIAAVVLGGTNIFGGEGSYLGTALGVAFLYLVGQTMLYAGVSEYWRTAMEGAVIVVVIGFDCAIHRRQKRLEELR